MASTHVHVTNHGLQTHSLPAVGKHPAGSLKPGVNLVARELWEHAKKHGVIAHHVEAKTFVESEVPEKKAPKPAEPEKKAEEKK